VARRGATTVEFALTAPILFALVLGALELSRANMLVHTASIAATEAARRSIIPGATANEVRLKALDELARVGVVDASVAVDPPEIVDDTAQVTVNLTVPVSMRNGYGLSRVFLGASIFKSVTLQREGVSVDVASEQVQYDGVQDIADKGNNGNGNGKGNNGNGKGNGGGNGSKRGRRRG
jgi:Flp pilus assembly protein TadG